MIAFLLPNANFPSGGIRRTYRHAEIIRDNFDVGTVIVQDIEQTWFSSNIKPISYLSFNDILTPHDIIVIPGCMGPKFHKQWEGYDKVIYNLGSYYTFSGYPLAPDDITPYNDPSLVGVVVVSPEDKAFFHYGFPHLKTWEAKSGIDTDLFYYDPKEKEKMIGIFNRKNPHHTISVLNLAYYRNKEIFKDWMLAEFENMNYEDYAKMLRKCFIVLYLDDPQSGFPGPAIEATACGCDIVMYGGNSHIYSSTPIGDFPCAAESLIYYIRKYNGQRINQIRSGNSLSIKKNYSLQSEKESVIKIWKEILS